MRSVRLLTAIIAIAVVGCSPVVGAGDGPPPAEPGASRTPGLTTAPTPPASSPPESAPESAPPGSVTPAPTASASTPQQSETGEAVRLAFAGDVHFERHLARRATDATGLAELAPLFSDADFAMLNLETAITTVEEPADKQYTFRADPSALDAIVGADVDAVSQANNHAVDMGPRGLADTLDTLQHAPLPVIGIGEDARRAYAAHEFEAKGARFAVLAATMYRDETVRDHTAGADKPGVASAVKPKRLLAAVRQAVASHDVVVVYLHWGTEGTTCPDARQRSMADDLARAGADVIVGTHAHRVQGSGWKRDAYVAYGLGNFVWYHNRALNSDTGVLRLEVDASRAKRPRGERGPVVVAQQWEPLLIASDGLPRAASEEKTDALVARRDQANECSGLASQPPR